MLIVITMLMAVPVECLASTSFSGKEECNFCVIYGSTLDAVFDSEFDCR